MTDLDEPGFRCSVCQHSWHGAERCPDTPCDCRSDRPGDSQPMPVPNEAPSVQSRVIVDIQARTALGISRYGTALQPFNGRDMLKDAYEEALDLAIYLKGAIIEREITEARMGALVTPNACPPHPYTSHPCLFQPGHEGDHLDALGDWWTGKTSAP